MLSLHFPDFDLIYLKFDELIFLSKIRKSKNSYTSSLPIQIIWLTVLGMWYFIWNRKREISYREIDKERDNERGRERYTER